MPGLEAIAAVSGGEAGRAAFEALAAIGGDAGRDALIRLADRASPQVRRGRWPHSAASARRLRCLGFWPLIAIRKRERRPLRPWSRCPTPGPSTPTWTGSAGKDANLREACSKAIGRIRDEVLPRIEARADRFPPAVVARLRRIYAGHAGAARGRLFAVAAETPSAAAYETFARSHAGDPARGRALFHDRDGLGCIKCHRVGGAGDDVGPDLSTVGGAVRPGQARRGRPVPEPADSRGLSAGDCGDRRRPGHCRSGAVRIGRYPDLA